MKFYLLLLTLFCVQLAHSQGKDYNRSRQVEQLQQARLTLALKIDSLQSQLPELATSIDNTRKKIDQLKKEASTQDRPNAESKAELSRLTAELNSATILADELRKKFDKRTAALDKALNLQKDLEDKIRALAKEN